MMRMNSLRAAILAVCCVAGQGAHAQLFGDDQARQAILDLRQRFDQSVAAQNRLVDENAQMRRGMLICSSRSSRCGVTWRARAARKSS